MKKNLKLLVSSAIVTLTFLASQSTWGMDSDKSSSMSTNQTKLSAQANLSTDESFKKSPFYQPFAIQEYRASVVVLRGKILKLQGQQASSKTSNKIELVQKQIDELENKLSLHSEALKKYGGTQDSEATKKELRVKIAELTNLKETLERKKEAIPDLREMYEGQIQKKSEELKGLQEYLSILDESENSLKIELEMMKDYKKELERQASSSALTQETINKKRNKLQALYEGHVKGLCPNSVFPHTLPKTILGNLGIPSVNLDNVDTECLFQLFARTLEFPYVAIETGDEIEQTYARQLKVLIQNLTNRLCDDVFTIELASSIAQNGKITFNFGEQNKLPEILVANLNSQGAPNEETITRDLKVLKGILSTYGYQEQSPSPLLESIIRQSPYGLLGLCIWALEYQPITSWHDEAKMGLQTRLKRVKTQEEFSAGAIENIYSILGRHINKEILQKVHESLEAKSSGVKIAPIENAANIIF